MQQQSESTQPTLHTLTLASARADALISALRVQANTRPTGGLLGGGSTLFGSRPADGLFGSRAQGDVPTGELYGIPAQANVPAGGLFSGFGSLGPANVPGRLFGSRAPGDVPTSGLFGSSAQANVPAGGLFGSPSQADVPGGGLFGSRAEENLPTGGLYSLGQANVPASGLFGGVGTGSPAQVQVPAGGLFGSRAQGDVGTGGLFGAGSTLFGKPGGLFGPPAQVPGRQFGSRAQGDVPTGGLFGGGSSLFSKPGGLFGQPAQVPADGLLGSLAQAAVQARVRAQTLEQARVRAQALEQVEEQVREQALSHAITYGEVLADSELRSIIYSIGPYQRDRLAHDLWRLPKHWWLIQIIAPITRLPQELIHQILLIAIDNASDSHLVLMRVSKHWYTIVTGIWASLRLGTTTPRDIVTRKLERGQWVLDVVIHTELDRGDFTQSEGAYQSIFAAIEASSRWRSLVVESLPAQADLPEHLVNSGLQQCSDAQMSRLRTFNIRCHCEMSPLLERLLRILGTTTSGELTTVEINSPSVISFLAPTYPSIFHSIKVLSLDTPGLPNPVDFLPHLRQLEVLTASHLSLPIYHNDVDIPFVHTLRRLSLKTVSIQWMIGRTFHALESCTLLFPLHQNVLHTFNATLPNCNELTFQGYPLDILKGISAQNVTHLTVKCPYSEKRRGSRQLDRLSSLVLQETRLALRILHINIEATSEAWLKAFAFMSNLEELVIDSSQPPSLGGRALQALIVHPVHASNLDTTTTPGGRYTPVCPSLKRFGLRYRRWLRPTERFDLIPDLVSIIWSREQYSNVALQSFRIWKGGEQRYPLELIEGSGVSLEGFKYLAGAKGTNVLQLVASALLEKVFKPCPLPHAL